VLFHDPEVNIVTQPSADTCSSRPKRLLRQWAAALDDPRSKAAGTPCTYAREASLKRNAAIVPQRSDANRNRGVDALKLLDEIDTEAILSEASIAGDGS
jgi:hypothetical protein